MSMGSRLTMRTGGSRVITCPGWEYDVLGDAMVGPFLMAEDGSASGGNGSRITDTQNLKIERGFYVTCRYIMMRVIMYVKSILQ